MLKTDRDVLVKKTIPEIAKMDKETLRTAIRTPINKIMEIHSKKVRRVRNEQMIGRKEIKSQTVKELIVRIAGMAKETMSTAMAIPPNPGA